MRTDKKMCLAENSGSIKIPNEEEEDDTNTVTLQEKDSLCEDNQGIELELTSVDVFHTSKDVESNEKESIDGSSKEVDDSGRWINLIYLAFGMTTIMSLWFSASAALPQFKTLLDLNTFEGSVISGVVNIGFIFGGVTGAIFMVSDRFSPRIVMAVGGLSGAAVNLLLFATENGGFALVCVARFLTGVCLSLVYGPGMKSATMWFIEYRGLVLGVMVGALTLGSSLPHLINGISDSLDYKWVVLASSVLSVLGSLVVLFLARDGPYTLVLRKVEIALLPKLVKNLSLCLAVLAYACHAFELYAMWSWVSTFYYETLDDVSSQTSSLFAFMAVGVGALGCVFGGLAADKMSRTSFCLIATIVSSSISFAIGPISYYTQSQGGVWFLAAVWGFFIVADSAQYSSIIAVLCPPDLIGTALTLQLSFGYAFTVAAMFLTPALASEEILGWTWVYCIPSAVSMAGVVLLLVLRCQPDARELKI